ncbi:hypothetical protein GCM10027034_08220 [Ramlibacter solisilvae]|uniref:Molecular chaperone DnaJ n=1 Tax=Ramlibacter tataouinensis TaxID=94132 RepID=A0A127JY23_9BURK|nr:hypothetical protein [Ramlibacter tataouinensis]AMO24814.1 hypothetical protein UC35_20715 [Ramlibacter tataouinensis]
MTDANDRTGVFDARELSQQRCPQCEGTGELRFNSENINENFEVEKQTVITECPQCQGRGLVAAG